MPFNWGEYITIGERLKNSTEEVDLRVSVSRGYYGVYHKTRIKLGFMSESYIPHETLIKKLKQNENMVNGKRLSSMLETLKQKRVDADYKSRASINKVYCNDFWARIKRYLETIEEED